MLDTVAQVRALKSRLDEYPTTPDDAEARQSARELVSRYLTLFEPTTGRLARLWGLHRLGVRRQDRLRNATFKLKLLTVPLHRPPKTDEDSGNRRQKSGLFVS